MKDEIKEIINDLQRVADRKCYPEDILCGSIAQEWVDYITNLQEENERVSNLYQTYEEANGLWIKKYEDYKSRNEKAIEYIHNHQPVFELSSKGQIQKWFEKEYYVELLNILNGGDDNE